MSLKAVQPRTRGICTKHGLDETLSSRVTTTSQAYKAHWLDSAQIANEHKDKLKAGPYHQEY